jgi:hypothetical protein
VTEQELVSWLHERLPEDAADFLRRVARLVRLADDLVDGDIEPLARPQAMSTIAYCFLLDLPSSAFYNRWQAALAPLLATCFATWAHTDEAKLSKSETLRIWGFVWRDSIDFMLYQTALLAVGPLRAREIIAEWLVIEHGGDAETFCEWEQSADGPLRQASEAA